MAENTPVRIVGISLVRNEEYFVTWSLLNVMDFCDELIVLDNYSNDQTFRLLSRLAEAYPKIRLSRVRSPRRTNAVLREYASTNTWVLGVDGDEIYDPSGLARLRAKLRAGAYADKWRVYGHTLHVTSVDLPRSEVTGHSTPTARSVTKLHNFGAVERWISHGERLHGVGRFRDGFTAESAVRLPSEETWDAADFRCLHLCFTPRSSRDVAGNIGRPNPSETRPSNLAIARLRAAAARLFGTPKPSTYKADRYREGPLITRSILPFGRPHSLPEFDDLAAKAEEILQQPTAAAQSSS
jgi:hypothetical protein